MNMAVAVKERPILFADEMVRAILDGRKTQTRRPVKPQPEYIRSSGRWVWSRNGATTASREWWEYMDTISLCPYGQPGDRLWVREAWALCAKCGPIHRADEDGFATCHPIDPRTRQPSYRWRPSIHMPRWASRITLEVTGVRVERLQEIKPEDACAEGVPGCRDHLANVHAVEWFRAEWNWIYGRRGYGWEHNPWVWVIDFRVLEVRR